MRVAIVQFAGMPDIADSHQQQLTNAGDTDITEARRWYGRAGQFPAMIVRATSRTRKDYAL